MKTLSIIMLTLAIGLSGCLQKVPDPAVRAAVVQTAVVAAYPGCLKLKDSLKEAETDALRKSLVAVDAVIRLDNITELAGEIAKIDKGVAPFASAIAGWILVGKVYLPKDYTTLEEYDLARGVVNSCLLALGGQVACNCAGGSCSSCDRLACACDCQKDGKCRG